jgi:hypothetical protein
MTGTKEEVMRIRWIVAGLVAVGLGLAGCSGGNAAGGAGVDTGAESQVQDLPGTDVKQVTLTAHAAQRLGIKTITIGSGVPATAASGQSTAPATTVVPYSAVLYAPDGSAWVYTVTRPLTYVRQKVTVLMVRGANGDEAVLAEGPPAGTTIVSTGVVELYGTELGLGEVTE